MVAEHVTAGEFERWMRHLDQQNRDILSEQRKTNGRVIALEIDRAVMTSDIKALKSVDDVKSSKHTKVAAIISVIVAAIAQGVAAAFGGK